MYSVLQNTQQQVNHHHLHYFCSSSLYRSETEATVTTCWYVEKCNIWCCNWKKNNCNFILESDFNGLRIWMLNDLTLNKAIRFKIWFTPNQPYKIDMDLSPINHPRKTKTYSSYVDNQHECSIWVFYSHFHCTYFWYSFNRSFVINFVYFCQTITEDEQTINVMYYIILNKLKCESTIF